MTNKIAVAPGPNGASIYTTQDGDVLDQIAWRHYGREWGGTTEGLLDPNPSALDPAALPGGIAITLPAVAPTPPPRVPRVRLFD